MNELLAEIAQKFEDHTFSMEGKELTGRQLRELGFMYDSIRFDYLMNFYEFYGYNENVHRHILRTYKNSEFKPTMSEQKLFFAMLCSHLNISPEVVVTHV